MKKTNKARKTVLVISIASNLLMLGIFKYAGFGAEMLNRLPFLSMSIPNIALPIGISFYTFQIMSDEFDVYYGIAPAQRKLSSLALDIMMFSPLLKNCIMNKKSLGKVA